jgi:hypothetical protein
MHTSANLPHDKSWITTLAKHNTPMDNDHLFVCFSMEAANAPEGAPPFHDDIKEFAREIDRNRFRQFFEDRYHWHWYPIISSGFSSFPLECNVSKIILQTLVVKST